MAYLFDLCAYYGPIGFEGNANNWGYKACIYYMRTSKSRYDCKLSTNPLSGKANQKDEITKCSLAVVITTL